jgi:hypothetical protein
MDCFLHYRFQTQDEARLIKQCFHENQIEFSEVDNLIFLTTAQLIFTNLAVELYQKLSKASIAKNDYLYLYTVKNQDNWFCIVIKQMGISRMYNIMSRLKKNEKK